MELGWACGGSIALYQMLAKNFKMTETITGSTFLLESAGFGCVNTLFPPGYNRLYHYFYANRHRRIIYKYYTLFEEFCGAKDFVAHDPAETAENILHYKNKYKEIQKIYEKAQTRIFFLSTEKAIWYFRPLLEGHHFFYWVWRSWDCS